MTDSTDALTHAWVLVTGFDATFYGIVGLSLRVSLSAVLLATLIGLPLGAWMALSRFPGRGALIAVTSALMGLPPVVAGLAIYILLSRAGPLGELGLLFTPEAMVIAQCLLVTPIIAALSRQTIADLHGEYHEQLRSLNVRKGRLALTLLWEGRYSLITAILAGFGRASAEVGAVMIVGGNIAGVTRVMTTTIALETSRGDLALALGLGVVLLAITLGVNAIAMGMRGVASRGYA
ncbi:MAG: ABC transporter permease [Pseudomonadota bacterium]